MRIPININGREKHFHKAAPTNFNRYNDDTDEMVYRNGRRAGGQAGFVKNNQWDNNEKDYQYQRSGEDFSPETAAGRNKYR